MSLVLVHSKGKRIGRTIEACMGTRKSIFIAVVFVDVELGNAVHAFEIGEPVEWCLACTCHKLQQLRTFLARETGYGTVKGN